MYYKKQGLNSKKEKQCDSLSITIHLQLIQLGYPLTIELNNLDSKPIGYSIALTVVTVMWMLALALLCEIILPLLCEKTHNVNLILLLGLNPMSKYLLRLSNTTLKYNYQVL